MKNLTSFIFILVCCLNSNAFADEPNTVPPADHKGAAAQAPKATGGRSKAPAKKAELEEEWKAVSLDEREVPLSAILTTPALMESFAKATKVTGTLSRIKIMTTYKKVIVPEAAGKPAHYVEDKKRPMYRVEIVGNGDDGSGEDADPPRPYEKAVMVFTYLKDKKRFDGLTFTPTYFERSSKQEYDSFPTRP